MTSEEKRGKARKSLAFFLGSLFLPGTYGNSSRLLNFLRIEITKGTTVVSLCIFYIWRIYDVENIQVRVIYR